MKKLKFIAVLFVVSLLLLSGCGKKEADNPALGHLDAKNPVTVVLWHYYVGENQNALINAITEFNQTVGMENGVIVDAVGMGSIAELEKAVTESAMGVINAAEMPQLFSSYPDKAMDIDKLDMLVDLNDYFTAEEQALYVEDFLSSGVFSENRLLLIPIVKSTELMYVNQTAWSAFAAAEDYTAEDLASWEALTATAKAYYEWTDAQTPNTAWDGTAITGIDSLANYIIIACKQLGLDVIDSTAGESGAAQLNEDVLRQVFETYYTNMSLGYFAASSNFRSDDIKSGLLISYLGSSSSAAYFPTWIEQNGQRISIDFTALPYPYFADGEQYAIQQGAGMCVAKSTPAQQEGAALFLKWFTDSERNIDFAMTTGYLPVQKDAYTSTDFVAVLDELRAGTQEEQNVAAVYSVALQQILEANSYAATPFEGSYSVRSILQKTLLTITDEGISLAANMKAQGLSADAIISSLDIETKFQQWLQLIKTELDTAGIAYE